MIQEIELFFKKYQGKNEIRLDPCTNIVDVKTFAQSHILALRGNSGNRTYLPYYERLLKCYKLLIKTIV